MDFLLEMREISKGFPGVQALQNVNFSIRPGEIVGLLGENGAGKSTLVKILFGVLQPDSGTILIQGRAVGLSSSKEALALGISVVSQEFNLCPNLSAAENLFLGREVQGRLGLLSHSRMRSEAGRAFERLGVTIDPDALVRDLAVAQQQMIELAKALSGPTRLLILDEPTAALGHQEVQRLLGIMRQLKDRGVSIVFISHRLNEVLQATDWVVCLKDGRNSGELPTHDADHNRLVSMMVGRNLDQLYAGRKAKPSNEVVLEVRNLSRYPRLRDVSLKLRRSEILGLAGLIGAGRTELARLIIGADPKSSGQVLLEGKPIQVNHPADAVRQGIAYVPEDRKALGLVLPMTVRENSTMAIHRRIQTRLGLIRAATERVLTDEFIEKLQIRVSSRDQITRELSGGNQQKVVLAKWLLIRPKVLILDEPTRGIDIGAKAEVHRLIAQLADQGLAILLISCELPEILHLADRVAVMHEGRLTAEFSRSEATEEAIMNAALA